MKRPVLLTVCGILNIVFGAWGLFGIIMIVVLFTLPDSTPNPMVRTIHENSNFALWMKSNIPTGFIGSGISIAAGIGLLRCRNWGRKLSIAYALFALATGIVGLLVSYAYVFKPFMAQAQGARGPEGAALVGGAVGSMIGNCFGLIYPILLLIFMMRPSVVAACQPPPDPPPLPPPTP